MVVKKNMLTDQDISQKSRLGVPALLGRLLLVVAVVVVVVVLVVVVVVVIGVVGVVVRRVVVGGVNVNGQPVRYTPGASTQLWSR